MFKKETVRNDPIVGICIIYLCIFSGAAEKTDELEESQLHFKNVNSAHIKLRLTLYLLVSSANNFCKQFGSRSGPTKRRTWSGSKLCDTLLVFLQEFFEKLTLKKKHAKLPSRQFVTDSSSFKIMIMGSFASRKCDISCNFVTLLIYVLISPMIHLKHLICISRNTN